MYGTDTPSSDEDFITIFMPNSFDLLGLQKMEQVDTSTKNSSENRKNTNEDIDDHQYALNYYVHLLLNGNPNLTEILFSANPISTSKVFQEIVNNKEKFISNRIFHSFSGFAYSQMMKLLTKKERKSSLEEAINYLEQIYTMETLTKTPEYQMPEHVALRLNEIVKHYKGEKNDIQHWHKGLSIQICYSKLKIELERYGWRTKTASFAELGFDVKFASHACRLLFEGIELLTTGKIAYPLKERKLILGIKNGELNINEVVAIYENLKDETDVASKMSVLADKPDFNWVNSWLVETLKENIKGEI